MAFTGAINAETRTWLGNIAPGAFNGRLVVVGCSGNFTVEQIITRNSKPRAIWGNDVSLYTSVLGAYFSGRDFRLDVADERLAFVRDYLGDTEARAATVLVLSEALKYENEKNHYKIRLWGHYVRTFGAYHAATVKRLRDHKEKIRLDRYTALDLGNLLDGLPEGAVVIAFMPTYAGGYEKLYKRMEEVFTWDRPDFTTIDDDRKEELLSRLTAFSYIYITDRQREGMPLASVARKRGFKTVYLYSNMNLKKKAYFRASIGVEKKLYRRLSEADAITPASTIVIQPASNNTLNYYKNLYLKKVVEYVSGQWGFLVFVDGRLFGFLLFNKCVTSIADVYLMSDFVLPVPRYPRLSKLLLLVSKSDWIRDRLQEKLVNRVGTILTTAFTGKPVSMKYRGLYKLHDRKPGRLNYTAAAGSIKLEEVIPLWLKRYNRNK